MCLSVCHLRKEVAQMGQSVCLSLEEVTKMCLSVSLSVA